MKAYVYMCICVSVHRSVYIWALTGSISDHACFCSGTWTLFFLQTGKLSAKRIFLFLNLARTQYRLPLQFHLICTIHRLMASDSLRYTVWTLMGKCHLLLSLKWTFPSSNMKEWKADLSNPMKEANFHLQKINVFISTQQNIYFSNQ